MESAWKQTLLGSGAVFGTEAAVSAPAHFGDPAAEYRALTAAIAVADWSSRTQIELTGPDRQTFLHNLCTNDIRRLTPGTGREAFLCNAQGHTLALVYIFCAPGSLIIETVPGVEDQLVAQLDRYLIREKVEIHRRTNEWGELLLAGPQAGALLRKWSAEPAEQLYDHLAPKIDGVDVFVRRVDMTGPTGYLLGCARAELPKLWQALTAAGARPCGEATVEIARIEAGTPYFGRDITSANLPQELARDSRAISFVKGCYIGQETVARLDAMGHVNRTLVGVRFAGQMAPPPGLELFGEGDKVLGTVTSGTYSPRLNAPLALAYVRRGSNTPGTPLRSSLGEAEVVSLPVA